MIISFTEAEWKKPQKSCTVVKRDRKDPKMTNPFDYLDVTYEEAKEFNDHLKTYRQDRDKRICICGHGLNRHKTNIRGRLECKPNAMYCKCKQERPILEAQDTRVFISKTVSHATQHALVRGLQNAQEKQHDIKWLQEPQCDLCGKHTPVVPMVITDRKSVV